MGRIKHFANLQWEFFMLELEESIAISQNKGGKQNECGGVFAVF